MNAIDYRYVQVLEAPAGDVVSVSVYDALPIPDWLYNPRTGEVIEVTEKIDDHTMRVRRKAAVVVGKPIYANAVDAEPYAVDWKVVPYDDSMGPMDVLSRDWLAEVQKP